MSGGKKLQKNIEKGPKNHENDQKRQNRRLPGINHVKNDPKPSKKSEKSQKPGFWHFASTLSILKKNESSSRKRPWKRSKKVKKFKKSEKLPKKPKTVKKVHWSQKNRKSGFLDPMARASMKNVTFENSTNRRSLLHFSNFLDSIFFQKTHFFNKFGRNLFCSRQKKMWIFWKSHRKFSQIKRRSAMRHNNLFSHLSPFCVVFFYAG